MRFFVSYSRRDAARISPLAKRLSQLGHEAWMDERITGGQAWWDEILANIRGADALLFAVSEASLESEACALERGYARSLGKPMLPVMVEAVQPQLLPPDLAATQFVDYSTPGEDAAIQLAGALGRMPAAPALPDPLPAPPPIPVSYLSDLSQKVAAQSLTLDEQRSLVANLEAALRRSRMQQDPDDHAAAHDLLRRLEMRSDLYAETERRITEVMAAEGSADSGTPHPTPESSPRTVPSPQVTPPDGSPPRPDPEVGTSPRADLAGDGLGPADAGRATGPPGGRRAWLPIAVGAGIVGLVVLAGAFALVGGSPGTASPSPGTADLTFPPSQTPIDTAEPVSTPEPTPETTPDATPASVPGAPNDPAPNSDEFTTTADTVMEWIPAFARSSCGAIAEADMDVAVPGATTEVICDLSGADVAGFVGSNATVAYYFFPNETDARLAYEDVLTSYQIEYDPGSECPETPGEGNWVDASSADTGGRVLCVVNDTGTRMIFSTRFGHPVVMVLYRDGGSMAALWDLWLNSSLDLVFAP